MEFYSHSLEPKKRFYFVSVSVLCIVKKQLRTSTDWRRMGEVAKREFYVLAYVKDKVGRTRVEFEIGNHPVRIS